MYLVLEDDPDRLMLIRDWKVTQLKSQYMTHAEGKCGAASVVCTRKNSRQHRIPNSCTDVLDKQRARVEWQEIYGTERVDTRQDHMEAPLATFWRRQKASGQSNLTMAAPNDPAHTARGVHCTHCCRFKPRDRRTDRQTPPTSVKIMNISCVWCSLKMKKSSLKW